MMTDTQAEQIRNIDKRKRNNLWVNSRTVAKGLAIATAITLSVLGYNYLNKEVKESKEMAAYASHKISYNQEKISENKAGIIENRLRMSGIEGQIAKIQSEMTQTRNGLSNVESRISDAENGVSHYRIDRDRDGKYNHIEYDSRLNIAKDHEDNEIIDGNDLARDLYGYICNPKDSKPLSSYEDLIGFFQDVVKSGYIAVTGTPSDTFIEMVGEKIIKNKVATDLPY